MANKLPTSLGNPAIPQAGNVRRGVATIDSRLDNDILQGAQLQGEAWHRTAQGLQVLGNAYDQVQIKDDKKEATDWTNQYLTNLNGLMWGDGTDANPGFMNMKGDGAVKNAKGFQDEIEKLRQTYLGKAGNKQVRDLFDQASIELTMPVTQDILQHAGKQKIVAADATDDATIDTFTNNLASNPLNATIRNQSLQMIANAVKAKLARQGIVDPVVIASEVDKATGAALSDAVTISISRNLDQGKALYGLYKDSLTADQQLKAEEDIKVAENSKRAEAEHNLLMSLRMQEIADNKAADAWANMYADPKTRAQVTPEAIASDPNMKGTTKLTFIDRLQRTEEDQARAALQQRQSQQFMGFMSNIANANESQILMSDLDDSVKASLITRRNEALKDEKNVLWEANELSLANDWLVRPETVTKQRIAGMALPESTKRIYNGMIDERNKTGGQMTTDWNTYASVLDGIKAGTINSSTQILESVGKGITMDQYTELNKVMTDRNKPENEAINSLWDDMEKAAKQQLDVSQEGLIQDTKGVEQTNKFMSAARKAFEQRVKKGENPRDLLDPENKDSLYRLINAYRRSSAQIRQDVRRVSTGGVSDVPVDYETPDDLKAAVRAGTIGLPEAKRIYKEKGWELPAQPSTQPTAPTGG